MENEIGYIYEKTFSDSTRNLLICAGIGAVAGAGCAVAYNISTYSGIRSDYDDKTAQTSELETTVNALAVASRHLTSRELIDTATQNVMDVERAELMTEVQAIKKDTPNIITEQIIWAGSGIIPGITLAVGAWASHRRWKKHHQKLATSRAAM